MKHQRICFEKLIFKNTFLKCLVCYSFSSAPPNRIHLYLASMQPDETIKKEQDEIIEFIFLKSNTRYKIRSSVLRLYPESVLVDSYNKSDNRLLNSLVRVDSAEKNFSVLLKMMNGEDAHLDSFGYEELKQIIAEAKHLNIHLWKQFKATNRVQRCAELQDFVTSKGGRLYKISKYEHKDVDRLFFEDDCVIDFSSMLASMMH